jgi:hypothetical protein
MINQVILHFKFYEPILAINLPIKNQFIKVDRNTSKKNDFK